MKMYSCIKSFKTTLFGDEPKRISIENGSLWFEATRKSGDKIILCNNKIELCVSDNLLKSHFERFG